VSKRVKIVCDDCEGYGVWTCDSGFDARAESSPCGTCGGTGMIDDQSEPTKEE
jgi:DnaJ-class molecular chaperone